MDIYNDPITKIRDVVKKVRKSPTVNDLLQVEVRNQRGSEKSLQLDCRTRWNSLLNMLEVFLDLHEIAKY